MKITTIIAITLLAIAGTATAININPKSAPPDQPQLADSDITTEAVEATEDATIGTVASSAKNEFEKLNTQQMDADFCSITELTEFAQTSIHELYNKAPLSVSPATLSLTGSSKASTIQSTEDTPKIDAEVTNVELRSITLQYSKAGGVYVIYKVNGSLTGEDKKTIPTKWTIRCLVFGPEQRGATPPTAESKIVLLNIAQNK